MCLYRLVLRGTRELSVPAEIDSHSDVLRVVSIIAEAGHEVNSGFFHRLGQGFGVCHLASRMGSDSLHPPCQSQYILGTEVAGGGGSFDAARDIFYPVRMLAGGSG